MRKNYRNEIDRIEKVGNVNVKKWRIDCIAFERDFYSIEAAMNLMKEKFSEKDISSKSSFNSVLKNIEDQIIQDALRYPDYAIEEIPTRPRPSIPLTFKLSFVQNNFAFSQFIINFLLKNANYKILSKLYSSCKQFFSLLKVPICFQLQVHNLTATVSYQHSLFVSTSDMGLSSIKKLYLTNYFYVQNPKDRYTISKLIPKIYKSDIKYFQCIDQILTLEEFKFICASVKYAGFWVHACIKDGERIASFFEIIYFMPLIKRLNFYTPLPLFPPNFDNQNIQKIKTVKIKAASICSLTDLNDPKLAYQLFINIAAPKSYLNFRFRINDNNKEILQNLLTNHSWDLEEEKPYFYLT